jgi:hypothetical protein
MLSFGAVILCSSLLTLHAGGVYTPNLILVFATLWVLNGSHLLNNGLRCASYGGISQTFVGMWEMFLGYAWFNATADGLI